MPLQCQSAGSKHCLSAAVYLRGTAFKQQSQLFDTSPSHLSAQPSPDVKAHLPIKHRHKTLIHPLFRLYSLSSHNYPWSHNQHFFLRLRPELSVCILRERKQASEGPDGVCAGEKKKRGIFIYRRTSWHRCRQGAEQTHAPKHTQTDLPLCLLSLSVAFLSLPLAVSQIPDDVLTGGLSDWRWGCVMTDQGLYQWPAHCRLAVWRLTGRLKPKTALIPAWLPASLHIFPFFFSFLFFLLTPSSLAVGTHRV